MNERDRRRWCQQKAKARLLGLCDGRHSFREAYARILRRWPASAAGDDFRRRLAAIWERETKPSDGGPTS